MIEFFRKKAWVARDLIPRPRLVAEGSEPGEPWKECVIVDRREFYHVVHRIEFSGRYTDVTGDKFHMINLVEGEI